MSVNKLVQYPSFTMHFPFTLAAYIACHLQIPSAGIQPCSNNTGVSQLA